MPNRVTKRKGSDNWWIDVKVKGRGRIRRSAGTTDRKTAEAIARRIEAQEWARLINGDPATLTFAEAVMMYVNDGRPDQFTIPLVKYFKDALVRDMKAGHIKAAAHVIYPKAKPATWNRQVLTPCQAIINHAASKDMAAPIKVERFKEMRPVRQAPPAAWFPAFLTEAPANLAALAIFMRVTGARVGQAIAMNWDAIDLQARTAVIPPAKGHPEREAVLPLEAVASLANIAQERRGSVFGYRDRYEVTKAWKRACKAAGIAYIGTHSAGRRAFATAMARAGVDAKTAAELGGWKTTKLMLDIYTDVDRSPDLIERVFGRNESQPMARTVAIDTNTENKIKRIV